MIGLPHRPLPLAFMHRPPPGDPPFARAITDALAHPEQTPMTLVHKVISGEVCFGVKLLTGYGAAVVFAADLAPAKRVNMAASIEDLISRAATTEMKLPAYAPKDWQTDWHVRMIGLDVPRWESLTSRRELSRTFLQSAYLMVGTLDSLRSKFPPLYRKFSRDPDTANPFGPRHSETAAIQLKKPSLEELMGTTASIPLTPPMDAERIVEDFFKHPNDTARLIAPTDHDEPMPIAETVIKVDITSARYYDLMRLGDTTVVFNLPGYSGTSWDQMHLVTSPDFLKKLVTWKRAFFVARHRFTKQPLLFIGNWEPPRGFRSSHNTIRKGLSLVAGPAYMKTYVEGDRGYIRLSASGTFEVYDLSGAGMRTPQGHLTPNARRIRDTFRDIMNIEVTFKDDPNEWGHGGG